MNKKLLLISRHPPYGNSLAKDAIDVALAASIYDQDIAILFMDDGVFQLIKNQDSQAIEQKSLAAMLTSLSLYGIDKVYIHKEALEQRQLTRDDIALDNVELLSNQDVGHLLNQQDHLLSF